MTGTLVLPELDILLAAFDRRRPDPGVVQTVTGLIGARLLLLVGWVRQGLLVRTADERQFLRLERALAAFPDLTITTTDHVAAAKLAIALRQHGSDIQPAQALLWVMAERAGAQIYTRQQRWRELARLGAPLWRPDRT